MDLRETLSGDTQAPGTDDGAQNRGIDIKRADDGCIMLVAALTDVDGVAVTSGTTTVRLLTEEYETGELWAVDWDDGSIHSSFDDCTTNTVEAVHQDMGGTFDTGLWLYKITDPETYFDEGFRYIVCFQNSNAVPVIQSRWWQYGGTEGEAQWATQTLSFIRSLVRADVDPDEMIEGDYTPATDSLEALQALADTLSPESEYDTEMARIDADISSRSSHTPAEVATAIYGTGANSVTLTLVDDAGNPISSKRCVVRNTAETEVYAWATTNADGEVAFNLDDGDYKVRFGPSSNYSFSNPYDLTVSDDTTQTYSAETIVIAPPSSPDLCLCYVDIMDAVGGQLVGSEDGSLTILELNSPVWPETSDDAVLAAEEETYYTNNSGRIQFEAVPGAELTVVVDRPGTTDRILTFTVPDEDSYYIPLSGGS